MSKFKNENEKRIEKRDIVKGITLITQLGLLMITSVFIGVMIGVYLDKLFKTSFIFTMIFSFIGMLAAFRNMYKYTMKK